MSNLFSFEPLLGINILQHSCSFPLWCIYMYEKAVIEMNFSSLPVRTHRFSTESYSVIHLY